jgi:hypothetical protein
MKFVALAIIEDSAEVSALPPVPVRINPKPITTSANVAVTYAIGR